MRYHFTNNLEAIVSSASGLPAPSETAGITQLVESAEWLSTYQYCQETTTLYLVVVALVSVDGFLRTCASLTAVVVFK